MLGALVVSWNDIASGSGQSQACLGPENPALLLCQH